jgi:hypothetical protein
MSAPHSAAAALNSPSPDAGRPRKAAPPREAVAPPREAVAPPATAALKPCACGHGRQAHQHYRPGKDCALCPCARYRRSFIGRWLR